MTGQALHLIRTASPPQGWGGDFGQRPAVNRNSSHNGQLGTQRSTEDTASHHAQIHYTISIPHIRECRARNQDDASRQGTHVCDIWMHVHLLEIDMRGC